MADFILLDAKSVEREIDALLNEFPDLRDDEALRADMLEGSTGLHSVMSRLNDHRLEAKAMRAGMKDRRADLSERDRRWERREDFISRLMRQLLTAAKQERVVLPEATVSLTSGRDGVDIIDADELPQGFYTLVRQPDKAAILASLKKGEAVPGATLVKGEASITVRTK